jgi:DUF4097 and DUF4098 domain-containing protein YvlB
MKRSKTALGTAVALFVSAMLIGIWGCDIEETLGAAIGDAANKIAATRVVSQTFDLVDLPDVRVETSNGTVTVKAADIPAVMVTATLRSRGDTSETAQERVDAIVLDLSQDGDVITIRYRSNEQTEDVRRYSDVSFAVSVPRLADVAVETANGDVQVDRIEGKVGIHTANGAIDLRDLVGTIQAETANGAIDVVNVSGVLDLETANGQIDILDSAVTVTAETSNGQIDFSGQLVGDSQRFRTSNGAIRIRVPADASITFDASTTTGNISTNLPLMGDTQGRGWLATLNPPATLHVELHTGNGTIRIEAK